MVNATTIHLSSSLLLFILAVLDLEYCFFLMVLIMFAHVICFNIQNNNESLALFEVINLFSV